MDPTDPDVSGSSRIGTSSGRPGFLFAVLVLAATSALLGSSVLGVFLARETGERVTEGVHVFYNEACVDCAVYVHDVLLPTLSQAGYEEAQLKDYINAREHREELNGLNDAYEVPYSLRSHLATYVFGESTLILQGHIPVDILTEGLEFQVSDRADLLLIYQDSMGNPSTYRVWSPPLEAMELDVSVPLETYFSSSGTSVQATNDWAFISLVLTSGLLDGLNPCAIAILLFFVSLLYVVRRPRGEVLQMGILYIYAIFLVYFLIGLGLMQAIILSGQAHLLAIVGAYLVIALGLLTLGGLIIKPLGVVTRTPHIFWERAKPFLLRATLPSAFAGGLLVGLCTFPCSGGIYVAILGLLSTQTSYLGGLAYLYLYNLMFVLPLVAILVGIQNRKVSRRLATWEMTHRSSARLLSATLMIAIGAVILFFFV